MNPQERELQMLRAEARYARDRLTIYRQRMLTGRDYTRTRLMELEREAASSALRLKTAEQRLSQDAS